MRAAWEIGKLEDCCIKIGSGATPRGGKEAYLVEGPFALIRSQNILDFFFSYNGLAFIDKAQADQLSNVEIKENDVLLNITGDSVARVCQVPNSLLPARVNQHVSIIRPDESKLTPEFLKYYLLNPKFKNHMLGLASVGGTRNALTKGMIEDFEIDLPPLETQRRIAAILTTLDEKIELNHQANQTLEAIAQALFIEWFVDFNFLDATKEMQDSELGPIPVGWRVGKLEDLGNIVCGKTPSKATANFFGGDIPFVKIPDMHNSVFVTRTVDSLTNKGASSQKNKYIPAYSIIVSCIATVGLVSIVSEKSQTNQQINAIVPSTNFSLFYVYFCAKNLNGVLKDLGSGGSATLNVNTSSFSNINCILPTDEVMKSFDRLVRPLFEQLLSNDLQTNSLTTIRDTLLPKLMNGEIEV